jgi:hypothetical protein
MNTVTSISASQGLYDNEEIEVEAVIKWDSQH